MGKRLLEDIERRTYQVETRAICSSYDDVRPYCLEEVLEQLSIVQLEVNWQLLDAYDTVIVEGLGADLHSRGVMYFFDVVQGIVTVVTERLANRVRAQLSITKRCIACDEARICCEVFAERRSAFTCAITVRCARAVCR